MALAPQLLPVSNDLRERASVIQARRLSLAGQNAQLQARYDEIMRWLNPPWEPISKRVDPRPYMASMRREGRPMIHADWAGTAVGRWAVLLMGEMPVIRTPPRYVQPPPPFDEENDDIEEYKFELANYELERQDAQLQASWMEQTNSEWLEATDAHRTMLWAAWAQEAFGKAILRLGWDAINEHPTVELMENPSQCTYAWTSRYGRRRLAWMIVSDQMLPQEANFRYGLNLPVDERGQLRTMAWTGGPFDQSDMDTRPEQSEENEQYVWADESWELMFDFSGTKPKVECRFDFSVAGRILDHQTYPWQNLPFRVMEPRHVPTYAHGKSTAETAITLNEAYDDLLDKQHTIISLESGPRYKGLNMSISDDATFEIPAPGYVIPLSEGEDIQQIDTRVDFWPSQVHGNELKEAFHWGTGLTPISLGMSPAAQTSGRALSAEWRAVEVPLIERIINVTPEIVGMIESWWEFGTAYVPQVKQLARGYNRFSVIWKPLDIRDTTEKINGVVTLVQNNLMDPELALEEVGIEDVPETLARIKRYLMDPVWNPLRFQQMLVLRQLALSIKQQEMQVAQQQAAMQPQQQQGQPPNGNPAEQGEMAAMLAAQEGGPQPGEGENQAGISPGFQADTQLLLRQGVEGGIGNQIMVTPNGQPGAPGALPGQGMSPAEGQIPQ